MKTQLSARGIYEPKITEEHVLGAIRQLLELNGARVYRVVERIPWGKKTSTPGIPDLFGWFPGHSPSLHKKDVIGTPIIHFFIEVKKPGGKQRLSQVIWMQEARRDGVIAFFADSVESMVKGFAEFGITIKGTK